MTLAACTPSTSSATPTTIPGPGAQVTTLAGFPGQFGSANGTGALARFDTPQSVAADSAGNIYVADTANNTIRKVTPTGVVTTLAGLNGTSGDANGLGPAARFAQPYAIATDVGGNVYVADANQRIKKITPAGLVSTLAGSGAFGSDDGPGPLASFADPYGLGTDLSGNVYVADSSNDAIRKVTPAGDVSTIVGMAHIRGNVDGPVATATLWSPFDVKVDVAGNIYIDQYGTNSIRKVTPGGVVSTLAGSGTGFVDGTGLGASFNNPLAIALDGAGNVYVADSGNNTIRKVTPGGEVSTYAGYPGLAGSTDANGTYARFNQPGGVAVGPGGVVYVADIGNDTIRRIAP